MVELPPKEDRSDAARQLEKYELAEQNVPLDALEDGEILQLGSVVFGAFVRGHAPEERHEDEAGLDRKLGASFRAFAAANPPRAERIAEHILANGPVGNEGDAETAFELSVGLAIANVDRGVDLLLALAYDAADPFDPGDPEVSSPESSVHAQRVLAHLRDAGRLTSEQAEVLRQRDSAWCHG